MDGMNSNRGRISPSPPVRKVLPGVIFGGTNNEMKNTIKVIYISIKSRRKNKCERNLRKKRILLEIK